MIDRWLRFTKTATIVGSLSVAVAGVGSWSQQSPPALADASLEELGRIQVFSASEHTQDARDAPSSVTVITAEEIQRHGYRTLADILRSVREFYVTYDRAYSYLGFRGYGRPGEYNTRILLLIDGHRTNDNIYDQAMLGTEFPLDVDLIERLEVIRGPGASLYGSNAFFAVINVITRNASELAGWQLSFEPASFNTYKARTSYGGEFKGADVLLSGSLSDSSGETLHFPEFNSPDSNNGFTKSADYDRYRNFMAATKYHSFTLQAVMGWRDKGIPTAPYQTAFGDPRTHSIDQHQYVDLGYQSVHGPWEVSVRTYYDRYGYDGYWPYSGGEFNVDYARGQRWGNEIRVSRNLLDKHRLTFGTEIRDNFHQDQRNNDTAPSPLSFVDSHRASWLWAGFIQDEFAITYQLKLNAGVRFDSYSQTDSTVNPRLGLIYRPVWKTTIKLLYGSAFRAPNVYEQYYGANASNLSGYQLNPRLDSEKTRNAEVVWEQDLSRQIRLSTNAFRNYTDGLISELSVPSTGMLMYSNAEAMRSTGVGAELAGHTSRGLSGSLAYSYSETENARSNEILVNSPRHLGKANFSLPLVDQSLFGALDMQYEGSRLTFAGNHVPAFPVANATLFGHTFKNRLDVSGSIYNLLNKSYFDVAPPEDQQDALRQDGRSFRLKLTWHIVGGK